MKIMLEKIYKNSSTLTFHTSYLGLVRSVIAFSSFLLLFFNPDSIMFHPGLGVPQVPFCNGSFITSINFFCLFPENPGLAKIIAMIILLAVISGFYPRITGVFHFWITYSINAGLINIDGGGQVAAMLTLLLIPLTLTDPRKNHWLRNIKQKNEYASIVAYINILVLKLQVAYIYFDAAVSKFNVETWGNGTALYYFFNDPVVGATGLRKDVINYLFDFPLVLVISTYSVLLLELVLAAGIFYKDQKFKVRVFWMGFIFHTLIFVIFGIFTFALTMSAALVVLFLPIHQNIFDKKIALKSSFLNYFKKYNFLNKHQTIKS